MQILFHQNVSVNNLKGLKTKLICARYK